MSELVIGGRTFRSRLFVGTGKFSSNELMARAIAASESEMVTVAMKRIDMNNPQDDMLAHVRRPEIQLLPNTSGVRDAEEAVELVGHAVGGVCPFCVKEGVKVYLDPSLRRFDIVYPACGSPNSAVKLTPEELELLSGGEWCDLCKLPEPAAE